jgi:hypothetical protein
MRGSSPNPSLSWQVRGKPSVTQRGNKEQGNSRARKYWLFLVGVVALGVLWLYLDRPVTTEVVNAVVTQGVWKVHTPPDSKKPDR